MNKPLPSALYTAQQVQQMDAMMIEHYGIAGFELMQRAAHAVMNVIIEKYPLCQRLVVLCGGGNNGGDGYLVAMLAHLHSIEVSVLWLSDPQRLAEDAKQAWLQCAAAGVSIHPFEAAAFDEQLLEIDLIVDALLGVGLQGEVRSEYQPVIEACNGSAVPVCAVDIPSGLCANTGTVNGCAIQAASTVTFIGVKQGLLTGQGREYCGDIIFAGLNIPDEVVLQQPNVERITAEYLQSYLPPRPRAAHKGLFGHVLLVGGNHGMPGAIMLAAEAALCAGAGRVTVATRQSHLIALAVRVPEIMAHGVESASDLVPLLQSKSAIVIGPGLGTDEWGQALLAEVLKQDKVEQLCPVVVDADALNLLAQCPDLLYECVVPLVVTPHPAEWARLLNSSIETCESDRFNAIVMLQRYLSQHYFSREQNQSVCILKGSGTLIRQNKKTVLCSDGNPAMAVAGMGDVLSGLIGALLAQHIPSFEAAQIAVWAHSSAADVIAKEQGEIGLRATALIPYIRQQLNLIISTLI